MTEIAVVGIAGRFPKARDVEEFWRNLRDGVESVSFFSDEELEQSGVDPDILQQPTYVKAGAFLEGAELFDADFFGYSPKLVEILNPQHRLFLECAWQALENAGYDASTYEGPIGIYAGSSQNGYLNRISSAPGLIETIGNTQAAIFNEKDFVAPLACYHMNLKGPGINVQTGCSTSLVAIHLACQALLNGECDIALAGGVSLRFLHKKGYLYQEGGILSPDGHCRAFDEHAQGTVSGDGVGVVVLKGLINALSEGDTIHAIIKGSAINNDGSLKAGFTAPSVSGQTEVVVEAQGVAGVEPETITYIEAHGTGTFLGDPVEIAALTQAFRYNTDKKGFCAIGSVKTNIGHLDAAAGIAGFIKTVLALKHKKLPPSLHFQHPNPQIDFAASPFYVNTTLTEWKAGATPRRAGVSSFGIGGTNAHVILEEPPASQPSSMENSAQILVLSGKTASALEAATENLTSYLVQNPDHSLGDVAWTLQSGRKAFAHRRMLVGKTVKDAIDALEGRDQQRVHTTFCQSGSRPIIFLFPGQGTQYVDMGRDLYQAEPLFREQIDVCASLLKKYSGLDLRSVLYPIPTQSQEASRQIEQTSFAQLALFVIEYALAKLWMAWGVQPHAMIGHSIGEYVAACLAGVISLEDALALVAARGMLMQRLPTGAMAALSLSEQEAVPLLGEHLTLAAVNGPSRVVVAGPLAAIESLEHTLNQRGSTCHRLHTSHAFHSKMMDPILELFTEQVRKVCLHTPRIPFISSLSGTWINDDAATEATYWAKQLRQTVRFAAGLEELLKERTAILLEVGPGATLSTLAQQHPAKVSGQLILASLPRSYYADAERPFLLNAIGQLWLAGVRPNWLRMHAHEQYRRIPLPTYPFERKRYWIDPAPLSQQVEMRLAAQDTKEHAMSSTSQQNKATLEAVQYESILATLKAIFMQHLGVDLDQISPDTSFLEIGADSLLLLQASQTIRQQFNVTIPFRTLFAEFSTFNSLARHISQQLLHQDPSLLTAAQMPEQRLTPEKTVPTPDVPHTLAHRSFPAQGEAHQNHTMPAQILPGADPLALSGDNGKSGPVNNDVASIIARQLQIMAQHSQIMEQQLKLLEWQPASEIPASTTSMTQSREHDPSPLHPLAFSETMQSASQIQQDDLEEKHFYRPLQKRPLVTLNSRQQEHVKSLIERLTQRTRGSKQLTQDYRPYLADNRSSAGFSLLFKDLIYPIVEQHAQGARIWDVDGNEYVDLAMGFGALLYGHSPAFIVQALTTQVGQGIRLGPQSQLAGKVAKLLCELTGNERVAFCNSGTEAVMTALRLARAVTGRAKIALFVGSFHGTYDGVLVRALHRADGEIQAQPLAPGVDPGTIEDVIILPSDRLEACEILRKRGHELAAVLVEPRQNYALEEERAEFLQELRSITLDKGIALIFDEVVTGFRTHAGGMQALLHIQADIVTYGKALGGGLPVGAIAGKAQYLNAIDGGYWQYGDESYPQTTQTFYAGTYFKHPFVMTAVWAALNYLKSQGSELQENLSRRTSQFAQHLNSYFEQEYIPLSIAHFSSLFSFVFTTEQRHIESELFFYHLLEKGVYTREGRTCCFSTAHTDEEINYVIQAVKQSVTEMRDGGFLRHADVQILPLTDVQKELWFLTQLGDDASSAYNEALPLRLYGPLQIEALRNALQTVVQRHEALRTTFSPRGDYQYVAPMLRIACSLSDFSSVGNAVDRETRIREWMEKEIKRPFDLAQHPLFRAHMVKLEEQEHLVLLLYHHIVMDGYSAAVVLRELAELYSAQCQGRDSQLLEPTPYSAYIRWQEQQQRSPEMELARAYWQQQFISPTSVLALPTDRPRPSIKTYNGARQQMVIGSDLYHELKRLSRQQGCTLFTVLLTGFALLLHRLTGQDDIVIGVPAAGQVSMGGEQLVGHCVHVLPIRSQLHGNPIFTNYLAALQETFLAAYEHQILPFTRLLKAINAVRSPGHLTLINTFFNLDRREALQLPDMQVERVILPASLAKYDLNMDIDQIDDYLAIACKYNTDLFDAETIQIWMEAFEVLLSSMVAQPQAHISEYALLSRQEYQRMVLERNAIQIVYPDAASIHEIFEAQVSRTPDAVALMCEDQHITYQQLNQQANRLAHLLCRQGVSSEVSVGICLHRSPQMIIALLAILKAGGVYMPLDAALPPSRLKFLLQDAQVALILTHSNILSILPAFSLHVLCLDMAESLLALESEENLSLSVSPLGLAYIMYTSGSTGIPKGVGITQQAVLRLITSPNYVQLDPQQTLLLLAPLSFDASTFEIWGALLNGARLVIAPVEQPSLAELAHLLEATYISTLWLTASLFHQLVEAHAQTLANVPQLLAGGEVLNAQAVLHLLSFSQDQHVINGYGPTENTTFTCCFPIHASKPLPASARSVPIGRPINQTIVYVLDAALQPVPIGVVGELYTGGWGLARGYVNQPALTAERFVPDPFSRKPGARLYRTGDLVRYRADGLLEFVGRGDRQIKLRGYRIELGEIEAALLRHPTLDAASVLVWQDNQRNKRLLAYLVLKPGQSMDANALRNYLRGTLPDYMIPARFELLDALPLSHNGKVNRQALPLPGWSNPLEKGYVPPLTPVERLLARIWSELLHIEHIGIHDNFFELGGDSMIGLRIVARANQAGLKLRPINMFQYQTIAELAGVVSTTSLSRNEQGIVLGGAPLTPIQHWFFEQQPADIHYFNQSRLFEVRQGVSASLIEEAMRHVLQHHDALRLRFSPTQTTWEQYSTVPGENVPFWSIDLSDLSPAEQKQEIEIRAAEAQASLHITEGPMLRAALFDLGAGVSSRFLIVIHHLVVDIVSWKILLEDLYSIYIQLSKHQAVQLPLKTTSYLEWAKYLKQYAQLPELLKELSEWQALARSAIDPLPVIAATEPDTVISTGMVSASLNAEATEALLRVVPRVSHTQVVEVLLTALVQTFAKWTGKPRLFLDLEGHGREEIAEDINVSRTVGWFTAIYPVLLDLDGKYQLEEALKAIKEQFRRIPGGGIGFGLLRYLSNDPAIIAQLGSLPQAEVIFNYQGRSAQAGAGDVLFVPAKEARGSSLSPEWKRHHLLEIDAIVIGNQLSTYWRYSERRHQRATIEHLAQWFIDALQLLIDHVLLLHSEHIPLLHALHHTDADQQKVKQALLKVRFEH